MEFYGIFEQLCGPRTQENLLESFGILWILLESLSSFVGLGLRSSSELLSSFWSILGALGLESISSLVIKEYENAVADLDFPLLFWTSLGLN